MQTQQFGVITFYQKTKTNSRFLLFKCMVSNLSKTTLLTPQPLSLRQVWKNQRKARNINYKEINMGTKSKIIPFNWAVAKQNDSKFFCCFCINLQILQHFFSLGSVEKEKNKKTLDDMLLLQWHKHICKINKWKRKCFFYSTLIRSQ